MFNWFRRLQSIYHAQEKINYWYDHHMNSFRTNCNLNDLLEVLRHKNARLRHELENLERDKE